MVRFDILYVCIHSTYLLFSWRRNTMVKIEIVDTRACLGHDHIRAIPGKRSTSMRPQRASKQDKDPKKYNLGQQIRAGSLWPCSTRMWDELSHIWDLVRHTITFSEIRMVWSDSFLHLIWILWPWLWRREWKTGVSNTTSWAERKSWLACVSAVYLWEGQPSEICSLWI